MNKNKKISKQIRKHRGIHQSGGSIGKLKKGFRYSGKTLKNGKPEIVKAKKKIIKSRGGQKIQSGGSLLPSLNGEIIPKTEIVDKFQVGEAKVNLSVMMLPKNICLMSQTYMDAKKIVQKKSAIFG